MPADAPSTPPTAWNDNLLRNPHEVADKRTRVQKMFAAIAPSYDINNRLHSLWMDQSWRRRAVLLAKLTPADVVVDVACGTGDLTIAMHRAKQSMAWATRLPAATYGVDFTFPMLPLARLKQSGHSSESDRQEEIRRESEDLGNLDVEFGKDLTDEVRSQFAKSGVRFINGDALSLPLPDQSADVLSIAFGIRNVSDPAAAIREFHRVLRPGGRLIILEFSLPTNSVLRGLYNFYFRKILPRTATLISRDKTGAYKYLPESVNTFITRETMMQMMSAAGFQNVEQHPMTFGVCVCYRGIKL